MKLGSLRAGGRDGTLVVVARDLARAVAVRGVAATLQRAIEGWDSVAAELARVYDALNGDRCADAFDLDPADLAAPLPRAYQWLDASAYLNHVELVRKARGADMPPEMYDDPLMYQGVSDGFLGPTEPIPGYADWGVDFEAEVAVITDDVPMGVSAAEAGSHIKLVMLVNDVSLRALIPAEVAKGFGFIHGKPASAFSPVAVTPGGLGDAWRDNRLRGRIVCRLNDETIGEPDTGVDMNFDFARLIAHAAKTRALGAGAIIGSGTVSNRDRAMGSACLAEKRALETLDSGAPTTPFMKPGDRVRIEMRDAAGQTVFGAIDQTMVGPAQSTGGRDGV